jgi:hypothetical protein
MRYRAIQQWPKSPFNKGHSDEGIRVLEQVYSRNKPPLPLILMLGQALLQRGAEQDVERAANILTAVTFSTESREIKEPVIISAVQALVRAQ